MKKTIIALSLACITLSPIALLAAPGDPLGGSTAGPSSPAGSTAGPGQKPILGTLPNPLKGVDSVSDLIYTVVNFVMSLSYIVIAFFLIVSGFKFVTAQGSEDKLNDAKKTFYYTIIGALILIGANTIVAVVKNIYDKLQ